VIDIREGGYIRYVIEKQRPLWPGVSREVIVSQIETGNVGLPGSAPEQAAQEAEERPPSPDVDITKPHVARMWDYYLGGKHNYAVDREVAEQVLKLMPETRIGVRLNRRFLVETVRWMVEEAGVRQFLDIGSGLPTQQNVHEVAQAIDPDARVVYVDNDPLVRVHAEALLATDPNTIFLTGDVHDPKAVLDRPELREHLDLSKPVGLLLVAVLHFVDDNERAYEIVRTLCDALPSGSYLAISHALKDERTEQAAAIYRQNNAGGRPRTEEEVRGFFAGLTPVGCGLTRIGEWTPPDRPNGLAESENVVALGDPAELKKLPGMCGIARIDR